ncbi:hypothetical protein L3V83_10980 [Thiotrichales bacterium 19X7-9]|nr:hypothetical protein [Thiotrichales bacterium 19X7-9]
MDCDYISIASNKENLNTVRLLTVIPTLGNKLQRFYRSSGRNSKLPGTFLPCEGVQETWIKKPNYKNIPEEAATLILEKEPQFSIKRFGNLENIFISMAFGSGIWEKHPNLADSIQNLYPDLTKKFKALFKTEKLVDSIKLNQEYIISPNTRQSLNNYHSEINDWLYQQKWTLIQHQFNDIDGSIEFKKSLVTLYESNIHLTDKELNKLKKNETLQKSIYLLYEAKGNAGNDFDKKYDKLKKRKTLQKAVIILDDTDIKHHRGWDNSSNWRKLKNNQNLRKSVIILKNTPELLKDNWYKLKNDKQLQSAILASDASEIEQLFQVQQKDAPPLFLNKLDEQCDQAIRTPLSIEL